MLDQYDPKQKPESQGSEMRLSRGVRLVEIFDSIQGEGFNAGEPMTFVRFSKCNLACDFCDTPYDRVAIELSEDELIHNLIARRPKWVNFTGGEPMLQLTRAMVTSLQREGILVTCESNGMVYNECFQHLNHVTISPKLFFDTVANPIPVNKLIHPNLVKEIKDGTVRVDELRYLVAGLKDHIFRLPEDVHNLATWWFVSPLFFDGDPDPKFMSGKGHRSPAGVVDPDSLRRCMQLIAEYRQCNMRLSLQTHKLITAR